VNSSYSISPHKDAKKKRKRQPQRHRGHRGKEEGGLEERRKKLSTDFADGHRLKSERKAHSTTKTPRYQRREKS
jgi:hypothetical protein